MRFPCPEHKGCDNFKHDHCQGCGTLDKYPAWFIEAGQNIVAMGERNERERLRKEEEKVEKSWGRRLKRLFSVND